MGLTYGLAAAAVLLVALAQHPPRTEPQKQALFEKLAGGAASGDAAKGRPVFEKACASCHRFGAVGTDVGPDLTVVNSRLKPSDIVESILWPSKLISDQFHSEIFELKDGEIVNGIVSKEDALRVFVKTAQANTKPLTIMKSRMKARRKSKLSLMPEGLVDEFSDEDIANLVAFIQTGPVK
jgi:putative heme-binding domain-containing protein